MTWAPHAGDVLQDASLKRSETRKVTIEFNRASLKMKTIEKYGFYTITMVYGSYNYSIHGVYKPTYNWGAWHCMILYDFKYQIL